MKSALVTGAGSFIGHELVKRLAARSIPTHVIVRPTSDTTRLQALPTPPKIHVMDSAAGSLVDIINSASPEMVFHLAGAYQRDESPQDLPNLIQSNIQFGAQLLDAVCRHQENTAGNPIKGLINTGSYFQYYNNEKNPLNFYAATKNAFEEILNYYAGRYGLASLTLVLFDTYGPSDWRLKLLPAIRDAQANGTDLNLPKNDLLLNFVHADDVIDCYFAAAEKLIKGAPGIAGREFAVRDAQDIRISELVAMFEELGPGKIKTNWGKWAAPDREIDVPWQGACLAGWQPKISLPDGIRQMIEGAR